MRRCQTTRQSTMIPIFPLSIIQSFDTLITVISLPIFKIIALITVLSSYALWKDFFTCAEGMKDEANEVVEAIAKKIVQDMPYEARVDAVVKYFAHERKMLLKKSLARRVHLIRSMYMKVVSFYL